MDGVVGDSLVAFVNRSAMTCTVKQCNFLMT